MVFTLSGVDGVNGDYLVARVPWTHDGHATPVEITGWEPVDPEPTQAGAAATTAADSTASSTVGATIVAEATKWLGVPYY
jgi:cell wall-associated NlpC family hydrolase